MGKDLKRKKISADFLCKLYYIGGVIIAARQLKATDISVSRGTVDGTHVINGSSKYVLLRNNECLYAQV